MDYTDTDQETPLDRGGRVGRVISLLLFLIIGLVQLVGGIYLFPQDGSTYYIGSGIAFLVIAALIWRNTPLSIWLYSLFFIAATFWGLFEVGTDFWALAPRYDVLFLLGIWLALPWSLSPKASATWARRCLALLLLVMLLIMSYSYFNDPQEISGSVEDKLPATTVEQAEQGDPRDWPAYARSQDGLRYSPLDQINSDNVQHMEQVWEYHSGDFKSDKDPVESTNEQTPIKIGNRLYVCSMHQYLDALDPATGKRIWRVDPGLVVDEKSYHLACRGVSYYDASLAAGDENQPQEQPSAIQSGQCVRKVILPVNDGRLFAVNADTGKLCTEFGDNGVVDLLHQQPYSESRDYVPSSPPIVTATTIVIGGSITDNLSTTQPSGVIRGYDAMTGKLKWAFDTGAEDPNSLPPKGQNFVHNSPNSWAPMAYDQKTNTVFVPTGVGSPDEWGGDRTELKERFANSILALDADTGKLKWHFQTTHHDLWDMDVPSQPTLVDLKTASGEVVPAVYVPTKTGNLFVLNRNTGEPVVPVTNKAVPQSVKLGPPTKGEHYSAEQPFSALNLAPQDKLRGKDMWGATMFDQLACRVMFKNLNYEGIYTPPSENGTLVFPGNLGVFEWGGISVDPQRQIAIMNPMLLPFVSTLKPEDPNRPREVVGDQTESGSHPMYGTPYSVELEPFLSPIGLPCKQPAWGYITAVDLKTHKVVWRKRLGTIRDSLSDTMQLPPATIGMPSMGAPISTRGNLIFIAASQDRYLRAYDIRNGDKLWEARLPAGGQATPMTYEINGRQYVVVMAGGHGSFGTKMGDSLVAFALPENHAGGQDGSASAQQH